MDKSEHALIGALSAFGIYGFYKYLRGERPSLLGVLGSVILGGFAAVLPDFHEPSTSPNHRSFFHSISLLAILAQGNQKMWKFQELTENQKLIISILSAAYGSHLVSDSVTPKSIPFVA